MLIKIELYCEDSAENITCRAGQAAPKVYWPCRHFHLPHHSVKNKIKLHCEDSAQNITCQAGQIRVLFCLPDCHFLSDYLAMGKQLCCTLYHISLHHVRMLSLTLYQIIFDECHKAKNLCPVGSSKPTKTGMYVLEIQNKLPKARIVYASATGKTLSIVIHTFIHSFYSFIHIFIHSFIFSFIYSFIHSFVHSFIDPFICSLIDSFIHLFIHLFGEPVLSE